jgi:hypothetical protein
MNLDFIDIGLIQLSLATLILFYCLVMLTWWWIKKKVAYEVYAYIWFLLLSIFINSCFGVYVRILLHYDQAAGNEFLHSLIWEWRYSLINIALIFISVSFTRKIRKELKREKEIKYG